MRHIDIGRKRMREKRRERKREKEKEGKRKMERKKALPKCLISSQAAGLLNAAGPVCFAAWQAVCMTAFMMLILLILKAEVFEDRYTTSAAEYWPPTSMSCDEREEGWE